MEPKISVELSATEIQNLGILLDAAVKATGIQGSKAAVPLYEKLEAAVAAHNAANANQIMPEKEAA